MVQMIFARRGERTPPTMGDDMNESALETFVGISALRDFNGFFVLNL
jgi:hypothetical protein